MVFELFVKKTAFWPICSFFSNRSHVFSQIKSQHSICVGYLKEQITNFHWILFNCFEKKIFKVVHLQKCQKKLSGATTPTTVVESFWKFQHRSFPWSWTILSLTQLLKATSFELFANPTYFRPLHYIFSNGSHVLSQIKNPNCHFVQNTLQSFRGEEFWKFVHNDIKRWHKLTWPWPGE